MASFEAHFQAACDAREIPGVVLLAESTDGKFQYRNASGLKSPGEMMDLDSTFVMASCSKLLTSIAALQCVERGQIGLDDDVRDMMTELKGTQIITRFDGDKPIFKDVEGKLTLRHLITHSSGLSYDDDNPLLLKWRQVTGQKSGISKHGLSLVEKISMPLMFEPGTSWEYGMSLDLTGLLIMRLNNMSLEAYFQKYLFEPLEIKDITFHPGTNELVERNRAKMTVRGGIENPMASLPIDSGGKVEWMEEELFDLPVPEGGEFGGQDVHPQLGEGSLKRLIEVEGSFDPEIFASTPNGTPVDYGLGGLIVQDRQKTGRREGSLMWSGLPNLMWTIDRKAGLACFYASNVMPAGDYASGRWQRKFEMEMYQRLAKLRGN